MSANLSVVKGHMVAEIPTHSGKEATVVIDSTFHDKDGKEFIVMFVDCLEIRVYTDGSSPKVTAHASL